MARAVPARNVFSRCARYAAQILCKFIVWVCLYTQDLIGRTKCFLLRISSVHLQSTGLPVTSEVDAAVRDEGRLQS